MFKKHLSKLIEIQKNSKYMQIDEICYFFYFQLMEA
jgi:hypothetical protein